MTDYREEVKSDVMDYIKENIDFLDFDNIEELEEKLNDDLWTEDSVTGNANGSYYCNAWEAEEAIAHNWDLLAKALKEFGTADVINILEKGAEWCDVIIRCYLLGQAISEAIEEIKDDFEEAHEDVDNL